MHKTEYRKGETHLMTFEPSQSQYKTDRSTLGENMTTNSGQAAESSANVDPLTIKEH